MLRGTVLGWFRVDYGRFMAQGLGFRGGGGGVGFWGLRGSSYGSEASCSLPNLRTLNPSPN